MARVQWFECKYCGDSLNIDSCTTQHSIQCSSCGRTGVYDPLDYREEITHEPATPISIETPWLDGYVEAECEAVVPSNYTERYEPWLEAKNPNEVSAGCAYLLIALVVLIFIVLPIIVSGGTEKSEGKAKLKSTQPLLMTVTPATGFPKPGDWFIDGNGDHWRIDRKDRDSITYTHFIGAITTGTSSTASISWQDWRLKEKTFALRTTQVESQTKPDTEQPKPDTEQQAKEQWLAKRQRDKTRRILEGRVRRQEHNRREQKKAERLTAIKQAEGDLSIAEQALSTAQQDVALKAMVIAENRAAKTKRALDNASSRTWSRKWDANENAQWAADRARRAAFTARCYIKQCEIDVKRAREALEEH